MTTLANTTQNPLVRALHRSGLLAGDLDYHIVRASMVIMFFFFGYQKWFAYEFERLVPFISNGPLIWWLYPVFGDAGATTSWASRSGRSGPCCSPASGTIGSGSSAPSARPALSLRRSRSFRSTGRLDVAAGGFPAMTGNVPFLMKDVVLLAISLYLLRQDVVRLTRKVATR